MIKSQFNYCPLVWMFCSRSLNNMINKVHERSLRMISDDYSSDFEELLDHNNDISNHHRNIQTLMIEMFKIYHNLAPPIMESMFQKRVKSYNLRNFQEFLTEKKRTVSLGLETISYRSPQLWSLLPENLKLTNSLHQFKTGIKKWICHKCPCRLCKTYVANLGFL